MASGLDSSSQVGAPDSLAPSADALQDSAEASDIYEASDAENFALEEEASDPEEAIQPGRRGRPLSSLLSLLTSSWLCTCYPA